MRRKWIITVFLLGVSIISFSQGTIKGKLFDSVSNQPMSLATITVFKAIDTTIVTYRLSDPQGNFKVSGLPFNTPLRTVISSSGYKVIRKSFTLSAESPSLDLGTIAGITDTTSLDEFLVIAERPPVTVRNDTIEFNAASFKTLPTALVEDLLKKFPGVEIDANGSIKVNGRVVNRILVDGRDFFGGDPKIATRNLPANLIDKVQVMDDKEELDRNPDISKAELGQVINLKFKKSVKKGWFGKVYAGGGRGSVGHYEVGGILNSFRDTLQVSVLGYTNNINKAGFGFEDIMQLGGFQRSGANSVGTWSDGGIEINGISFGATGSGIQRSTGAGININHDPSKKVQLNFQYFLGKINSNYNAISNTSQFLEDTVLKTFNNTKNTNEDINQRFGFRLKWKIDSLSSIDFTPSFTHRNRTGIVSLYSESGTNFDSLLNNSINAQDKQSVENIYEYQLNYNRSFKKKNGAIFISHSFTLNSVNDNFKNDAFSTFFKGTIQTTELNQLRNQSNDNLNSGLFFSGNRKINKKANLRFSNSFYVFKGNNIIRTYDLNPLTGQYELLNAGLSNGLERNGLNNIAGVTSDLSINKLTFSPGLQWQRLDIVNNYENSLAVKQKYDYILPTLGVRWKSLSFNYRILVQAPSSTDLNPVVDNSNPLYQIFGNPDLTPTKRHSFSGRFFKYNTKRLINIDLFSSLNYSTDAIIRERFVSPDGVQITKPVNVDDVYRGHLSTSFTKQYKFSNNWKLDIRPSINFNLGRNFVIVNGIKSVSKTRSGDAGINFNFNWNDKLEISQYYTFSKSHTEYQSNKFRDLDVITHYATTEVVIRIRKNWVWESTINYRHNPQVSPGIATDIFRWNSGVNFLFLKEQKGQLKLFLFDILKQNSNSYRIVNENYVQDVNAIALTRYIMLTFTYNLRDFKGRKVGGSNSLFSF